VQPVIGPDDDDLEAEDRDAEDVSDLEAEDRDDEPDLDTEEDETVEDERDPEADSDPEAERDAETEADPELEDKDEGRDTDAEGEERELDMDPDDWDGVEELVSATGVDDDAPACRAASSKDDERMAEDEVELDHSTVGIRTCQ